MLNIAKKYLMLPDTWVWMVRGIPTLGFGPWSVDFIPTHLQAGPCSMRLGLTLDDAWEYWPNFLSLNSGYRTCEQNAAAGGVEQSSHLFGIGADVGMPAPLVCEFAEWCEKRGVPGVILHEEYVHIDFLPRDYSADARNPAST